MAFLAHRAEVPGEGGVHGLPEHPPGRRPQAGAEEAAKFPGGGGELSENGLAACGDDGDDQMPALARQIVSGEEDAYAESVEQVFVLAGSRVFGTAADEQCAETPGEPRRLQRHRTRPSNSGGTVYIGVRLNLWLPSLTALEPAARPMLSIRPAPMPAMSRSWRVRNS